MEAKKKKKVWPFVLIAIVLVIVLVFLGLNRFGKQALATLQGATIAEVETYVGEITSTVSATGTLSAGISEVYVPYGVEISEIDVEAGDFVVAGKRVARINSYSLNTAIDDCKEDLKDVNKVITDQGEQPEYITLRNNIQAKLDTLNALKEKKELYATTSGVISTINVSEYSALNRNTDAAAGNQSESPADPTGGSDQGSGGSSTDADTTYSDNSGVAFVITPLDKYSITVSVDELDILSVVPGQTAKVTMDALPGEEFAATVVKVSKETKSTNGVSKYSVVLSLEKTDAMRIGMNTSVVIATQKVENVIILPALAIQEEGDDQFVYTTREKDGTLSGKTIVETGLSDGTDVEIKTGLNEGDTVFYNVKISSTNDLMMGFGGGGAVEGEEVTSVEVEQGEEG